jgi:hypothetical protein
MVQIGSGWKGSIQAAPSAAITATVTPQFRWQRAPRKMHTICHEIGAVRFDINICANRICTSRDGRCRSHGAGTGCAPPTEPPRHVPLPPLSWGIFERVQFLVVLTSVDKSQNIGHHQRRSAARTEALKFLNQAKPWPAWWP